MRDENGNLIEDEEEVVEDEQLEQDEAPEEEVQNDDSEETEDDEESLEDEEDDSQKEEEEKKPSRREQLRINDLLQKYGNPTEDQQPRGSSGINYRELIDADEETYKQLEQKSQQFGSTEYSRGLKEANKVKFETRLDIDAPRVADKYPQLDKESDDFKGPVANSINQMYLSAVGYDSKTGYVSNPSLRYYDYVEAIMELVDEAASRQTESTKKTVTKQASRTGVRPGGSSARPTSVDMSKPAAAMSDKELDAAMTKLGLAPKK